MFYSRSKRVSGCGLSRVVRRRPAEGCPDTSGGSQHNLPRLEEPYSLLHSVCCCSFRRLVLSVRSTKSRRYSSWHATASTTTTLHSLSCVTGTTRTPWCHLLVQTELRAVHGMQFRQEFRGRKARRKDGPRDPSIAPTPRHDHVIRMTPVEDLSR